MNYFQETLQGTKRLDKIFKKLKRYWQNIDLLTFYARLLCSFLLSMNLKLSDEKNFRTTSGFGQINFRTKFDRPKVFDFNASREQVGSNIYV